MISVAKSKDRDWLVVVEVDPNETTQQYIVMIFRLVLESLMFFGSCASSQNLNTVAGNFPLAI